MSINTPGSYWGRLVKFGFGEANNERKTPYVWLAWNVTHRRGSDGWVPLEYQEERTVWLYVSDPAWEFSREKLEELGFNGRFDENMDFSDSVKDPGHELIASINEYEGKSRLEWNLPRVGGGTSTHKEGSASTATRLGAKWKGTNAPAPSGGPSAPPAPTGSRPIDEKGVRDRDAAPF